MLEAKAATLRYFDHGREVFAVQGVNLVVQPNEFLGILGPSGSGKSSLLYLLSGLKTPTAGEIAFDGRSLSELPDKERSFIRLREFGFIFQQPYLLGYLSALENVLVASPETPAEDAHALLTELGLGPKAHRQPHELSGGEKQRVCVARALIGKPKVIFADEPTAALDHANGVMVVDLLNRLRGQGALVMVTHDPTMLVNADRTVRLAESRLVS
jgi:putative ABC transport system ATP-binding protein